MKIQYTNYKPQKKALALIEKCNEILEDYAAQGFDMTLRQLYYQLVSQNIIPNTRKGYNNLSVIVSKARIGGLIDWDFIVDRTRNLQTISHWTSPGEIIEAAAESFKIDKWENQPFRPEIWIEKEALAGVLERVCRSLDVPLFSCRGYASQSEMHPAAMRLKTGRNFYGQTPVIFHFGDHDPSGLDMTRDIKDRLELFLGDELEVKRLALNINQVRKFNPPPNPAKLTDSRAKVYIREFGQSSWELDALNPETLADIVRGEISELIDGDAWRESEEKEESGQAALLQISENFTKIQDYLQR